jgi:hypothetical protein
MSVLGQRVACASLAFAFFLMLPPLATRGAGLANTQCVPAWVDDRSKELQALTAAEADDVAGRDLLSVLQPTVRFQPDSENDQNVEGMTFVTWPYPTEYPSVCREDAVTLGYTRVDFGFAHGHSHDRRIPQGVEAQPLFHIGRLPVGQDDVQIACDAQHLGAKAGWFAASNVSEAVRVATMFRAAEDRVKAGTLTPQPCRLNDPDACRRWVASLDDVQKIKSVAPCPDSHDDICYVVSFHAIWVNGDQLTIHARKPNDESTNPTDITSIEVTDLEFVIE